MPESNQVCPIGSSVSRPELGRRFCTQQFSLAAQQIRLHQVVCGNQSPSAEVPMSWPYVTECKTLPTDLPPDVHHDVAPPLLWHLPHSCRLAPSAVVVGAGQLRDCERDDAQHLTYCTAKTAVNRRKDFRQPMHVQRVSRHSVHQGVRVLGTHNLSVSMPPLHTGNEGCWHICHLLKSWQAWPNQQSDAWG